MNKKIDGEARFFYVNAFNGVPAHCLNSEIVLCVHNSCKCFMVNKIECVSQFY